MSLLQTDPGAPNLDKNEHNQLISLSGWNGVIIGVMALIAAAMAYPYIYGDQDVRINPDMESDVSGPFALIFNSHLFWIGIGAFIIALLLAYLRTQWLNRRAGIKAWGEGSRREAMSVMLPLIVGIVFIVQLYLYGNEALMAPSCLIFYGLSLLNASHKTHKEILFLAYGMLILGLINLRFAGHGLIFWTLGFGLLHILYGLGMWKKGKIFPLDF